MTHTTTAGTPAATEIFEDPSILPLPRRLPDVVIEPSPRWVRAYFGGVPVADSKRVLLVYEPQQLPVYWFPVADVRQDLLTPAPPRDGDQPGIARWQLRAGDRVAEHAAWSYPEPDAAHAPLADHIAFTWSQMDAWFEEDDEVFVHPRDPFSRVDVLHSSRHVRVELAGHLLAESRRPRLLFESGLPMRYFLPTRYYLPKQDVRLELLEPSATWSRCPHKGVARYWSVRLGETLYPDIVWSYPHPIPEIPKIENLLCFFNEKVDLTVDGEPLPRPITPWSDRES